MSWDNSDRKSELPRDWESKVRPRILKRDGYQCVWRLPSKKRCPRRATDVDHIRDNDDHSDSNLRSLCGHHHAKRTARQGELARKAKWSKKPRRPVPDPGALG